MSTRKWLSLTAALLLLATGPGFAEGRLKQAAIYLERNISDEDAEVRLEVTGSDEGLARLRVVAPDGRMIVDFSASDSKLGMRHFNMESPEPRNDGRLQADFPAGTYRFAGTTSSGRELQGTATLSHSFPPGVSFVSPRPDQKAVPVAGMRIRWSPVANLAAHVVVIEQEETGHELRVVLPGSATEIAVPDGFLMPGKEYTLAVGSVSQEGNRTFVETKFRTAGRN